MGVCEGGSDSIQWPEFFKYLNYRHFKMNCSAWNCLFVCWLVGFWLVG